MNEATQKSRISFMKNYSTFSVSLSLSPSPIELSQHTNLLSRETKSKAKLGEKKPHWEGTFFSRSPATLPCNRFLYAMRPLRRRTRKSFFDCWKLIKIYFRAACGDFLYNKKVKRRKICENRDVKNKKLRNFREIKKNFVKNVKKIEIKSIKDWAKKMFIEEILVKC